MLRPRPSTRLRSARPIRARQLTLLLSLLSSMLMMVLLLAIPVLASNAAPQLARAAADHGGLA